MGNVKAFRVPAPEEGLHVGSSGIYPLGNMHAGDHLPSAPLDGINSTKMRILSSSRPGSNKIIDRLSVTLLMVMKKLIGNKSLNRLIRLNLSSKQLQPHRIGKALAATGQ